MARGINRATVLGNLGADPETKYMPDGTPVTTFTVATGEAWTDKATGQAKERTDWHNVTTFGKLATIAGEHLKKGGQVYIEGSMRIRKYQDKNSGDDKFFHYIRANVIQMLGKKPSSAPDDALTDDSNIAESEDVPF